MASLLTGSDSSPVIVMLLVSGADSFSGAGASGLGPPQAARSKTAATADHILMRMGKH
jgi:hypothetical protein